MSTGTDESARNVSSTAASEAASPDASQESIIGDVSEEIFFDLADSFIELANQHSERLPVESISTAMLYAASRYNAFLAASDSVEDRLQPETAADFYTLQYRKMFEDNLQEYIDQDSEVESPQTDH